MSKIGQSVRLQQKDKGPYYVIGIVQTDEGYEVRKLKMAGDQVENLKTLFKTDMKSEALQRLQIETTSYIIEFNQKQVGGE